MNTKLPWKQRLDSHRTEDLKKLYLPKARRRRLRRVPRGDPFAVIHVHFKKHVPRCIGTGIKYVGCAVQELRRVFAEEWTWAPGRAREIGAFQWRDDCRTMAGADNRGAHVDAKHSHDFAGRYNVTQFFRDFGGDGRPWKPWRPNDVDCGARLNADGKSVSWVLKQGTAGHREKTKPRNEYYDE